MRKWLLWSLATALWIACFAWIVTAATSPIVLPPIAAQRPLPGDPEQYPGQRDHAKPPEGWTCQHQTRDFTVPPAHVCACSMTCMKDPATGVESVQEQASCAVWCHKEHCDCVIPCTEESEGQQ